MATKKSKLSWSGAGRAALTAASVTLVVAALQLLVPAPELAVYNTRMRLERMYAPVPQHPDVVVVTIDDQSLASHGRWPWPRRYWAMVLDALLELKVKGVFFDIVFPDPTSAAIQTAHGKMTLQDAILMANQGARAMLDYHLKSVVSEGASRSATDIAKLDEAFRSTFDTFVHRLDDFTKEPDQLMGDRLTLALRRGLLTGGVSSVPNAGAKEEAARASAYRRALLWIVDHPGATLDQVPEDDRRALGPRLAALAKVASAVPVLAGNPHARLAEGIDANALREELILAWFERALAGKDAHAAASEGFQKLLPAPYLALGELSKTLWARALSQRLIEDRHLWQVDGAGEAFPWAIDLLFPTFEIARGYGITGMDWETKDTDGMFRAVPLMTAHGKGFLPTGGLAVFLAGLTARSGQRPKLALEGRDLVITPKDGATVRVPLEPGGRLLINWTGPFNETFSHVPAGTLLSYVVMKQERDQWLATKLSSYEPAIVLLEKVRELQARSPQAKFSITELARLIGRSGSQASLLNPKVPSSPAALDEGRTPDELATFFEEYTEKLGGEYIAKNTAALRKKLGEPDLEAQKAARYRSALAEYERHGEAVDALRAELKRRLESKFAFVGHTATSSTDLAPMPFSTEYPKVGSYPNVLSTLSSQRFIRRPWTFRIHGQTADGNPGVQVGPLFLVCLISALAITALSARRGMVFSSVLILAWAAAGTYVFVHRGIWLDIAAPITGIVLTHGAIFSASYGRTENIRKMFESYVDPHIVEVILEDETLWTELGGREQEITAFFSDIAGFTTLSELLGPHELSEMLTDYLSPMTDIILHHDGIRDKYIGDAIVAFFGAPVVAPGHELNACLASIEQTERIVELKKKWIVDKKSWYEKILAHGKDLEFRIGLNTGKAKVGNFGAHNSKNYTMIGDTVNLAARLEGANKEYDSFIMCGENTRKALGDKIVTRELDRLVVKGKIEAVRVHEVIGRAGSVAPFWPELLGTYAKGLELYHAREFHKAKETFEQCLKIRAGDGPSGVYVERSEAFIQSPPPADWNGAYVMLHK